MSCMCSGHLVHTPDVEPLDERRIECAALLRWLLGALLEHQLLLVRSELRHDTQLLCWTLAVPTAWCPVLFLGVHDLLFPRRLRPRRAGDDVDGAGLYHREWQKGLTRRHAECGRVVREQRVHVVHRVKLPRKCQSHRLVTPSRTRAAVAPRKLCQGLHRRLLQLSGVRGKSLQLILSRSRCAQRRCDRPRRHRGRHARGREFLWNREQASGPPRLAREDPLAA